MPAPRLATLAGAAISFAASLGVIADHGLNTRELNPMLQPVYLPGYSRPSPLDGWWVEHNLFVTNTSQEESRRGESLVIDVENYRYELDIGYRRGDWVVQARLPYLANSGGNLDHLIDEWHSIFGLPDGDRNQFERDQIEIEYLRDGETVYAQTASSRGLADIAVSFGYQREAMTGYYFGVELPTGSEDDFSGNEAVDIAFWLARSHHLDENMAINWMFGVSIPGDGGPLEDLLAEQIWIGQLGFDYRFSDALIGVAQLDMHTPWFDDSSLRAFGFSTQILFGLGFTNLIDGHRLDLFFSEDIHVESAPDITLGLRLARDF